METQERRGLPLATRIFLGLTIGALCGVGLNALYGPRDPTVEWIARNVAQPVGQVFLRLLFMVVIPLVFCSLTLGVAGLGRLNDLGRVGSRTILWFLASTAVAACLGILLVNTFHPGRALSPEKASEIRAAFADEAQAKMESAQFGVETFVEIVPRNVVDAAASGNMLAVIFFALMCGVGTMFVTEQKVRPFLGFLEGFYEICIVIIRFAMRLAPYGVAGLIFSVTARFGGEILNSLALYLVTVIGGLLLHQFVVLGLAARWVTRLSPFEFYRRCRGLMVTAFSTSSSSATLPTTMRTAEEHFGVPTGVSGFVLPLGATMNMNGTALFEGVSVLFLAEVAGVHLPLSMQVLVVLMTVLTAIGAAGVPGGSLPLLAVVLGQVGVPPEMLAVILGVDRIVDMARTVPNVTSDLLASIFVARCEGRLSVPRRDEDGD